jgi:energy-converting hydrogenase Eha subunit C
MNFAKTTYGGTIEILASKDFQAIPAKLAAPNSGTVVKAGTPINASGESTTGSGAIGILLYDVDTAKNPNGALVVQGIIDSVEAQAHSEVTYVSALYSALPGIVFRTNIGAQGATGAT